MQDLSHLCLLFLVPLHTVILKSLILEMQFLHSVLLAHSTGIPFSGDTCQSYNRKETEGNFEPCV